MLGAPCCFPRMHGKAPQVVLMEFEEWFMPSTLLALVRCLVGSQCGATAIEYSVIAALIAIAITAALNLTGLGAQNVFGTAANAMT